MAASRQKAPKTLAGLYNAETREIERPHSNTVRSQIGNTKKRPAERPQEVYTPGEIVDLPMMVWGEIGLDPCWGPGSIVPSMNCYYVPPRYEVAADGKMKTVFVAHPGDQDGLDLPWAQYTFVNPPYAHPYLSRWLRKAQLEYERYSIEIMLLCPVRPHRKWWRDAYASRTRVAYLDPVRFLGAASAAPFPLCVFYWGDRPNTFDYCVRHLGLGETF